MLETFRHPTLYQSGISGAGPSGIAPGTWSSSGDVELAAQVGEAGVVL